MQKADISGGRCPPELGRVSLESTHRGDSELNGIGLEASAWLQRLAGRKRQRPHPARADVC